MDRISRILGLVCLFGLTPLWTAPLSAQTAIVTKKATVTFSGKLDIVGAYRNSEYFTATKGDGTPTNPGNFPFVEDGLTNADRVAGPGSTDRSRSEFYLDPNLKLDFEVDVGKAKGLIELRTPFVNPDAAGKNNTPGTPPGFFAGFKDRTLELKQAYIQLDELFAFGQAQKGGGLLLRAGLQDFRKDLRGDGNAFIIDTAGSEHPFDSSVPGVIGVDTFAGLNTGAPPRYSTGLADTTEPAGGYARYGMGFFSLDGWIFDLDETFNATIPTSAARRDMLFWGFSTDVPFGEESKYGKVFLTVFDLMNTSNGHLVTEGGGLVVYPLKGEKINIIELFGEIYFQQGSYARDVGNTAVFIGDIDQKDSFALNVGAKARMPGLTILDKDFIPYAEGSYVEVSGDDDSTDDENSNFVSLENNNRTVVVENGYYGYDIDANYRGVRAALGFTLGDVYMEALYAYFELQDNSGGRVAGDASRSPKIGDEVDLTLGFVYSANVKVQVQHGMLFDSHALGQKSETMITLFSMILEF